MFSIDVDLEQGAHCGHADEHAAEHAKDLVSAELWEAGCAGIVELSESRLRAFFDDDARQPELLARFGGTARPADTRDWVAFAHEFLKPMEIGGRIFVCPEWRTDPTPAGRVRIEVNAGLAFGTGAHETTRLCLEALDGNLEPGMTVADIGTGSGILAEAAAKLGAGGVYASDTDPDAVAVARENFERARVRVNLRTGSTEQFPDNFADIVLANISPAWIADLASEWLRILKPAGIAILSGFEAADVPRVRSALAAAGARITGEFGDNEWRLIQIAH